MANEDFTTVNQSNYQYTGKRFPVSALTGNQQILRLAGKLWKQAVKMEKANYEGKYFAYEALHIPKKLQHIFGI